MPKKNDLIRLTALALILLAVFVVVILSLPVPAQRAPVPTLMQLPSETDVSAVAVVAAPTHAPETLSTTSAPSAVPDNQALSTEPLSAMPPTPTLLPTIVAATASPTETNTLSTTPLATAVVMALPTALPFPTLPLFPAPTYSFVPAPLPPPQATVPNQVVIAFKPETSQQERDAYVASLGGQVKQSIDALNTVVVEVPQQPAAAIQSVSDIVAAAEPDYYVSAQMAIPPSDPYYSQQWALPVIGALEGWQALPAVAPKVVVAVIDSGICADNPDLSGRVLPGWDFVENDTQPQDAFGHGCAVAGIIAANDDDGIGIAGVAPNALILPLRVLNAQGIGTYSDVAAAIVYAADHGAQVINLSLGGANASSVLEQAVNYAVGKGVTIVAAAGNTGNEQVLYPAAYTPVVAVGSVDQNLQVSSFSSRGAGVDVLAPGRDILTTWSDGTVRAVSGTSFAAPQVAAIASLEIANRQTLNLHGGIIRFGGVAPVTEEAPTQAPIDENSLTGNERALLDEVRAQGQTDVIVGLNIPFRYADQASPQELAAQDVAVQQARTDLLSSLSAYNVEVLSDSTTWSIPFVALRVDENALVTLFNSPEVTTLEPNGRNAPSLQSAEPVIHAPQVWAMGYTGSGQTVAIVDTGVDRTHPFLNNHVILEGCFSSNGSGATSNCPNGLTSQSGTGSASPSTCFANLSGTPSQAGGCAHGTHVSGIAAGFQSTSFSGVAPSANIIGVDVFSKYHDPTQGDFLTAFDSDIISGLNYVYSVRGSYSIASVNLSLGDFGRASSSTCDATSSSMTSIFQLLRSAGIAPVVAAGNNSSISMIAFPACISYAVSVGATTDADAIASFSNRAPFMSLFAPGVSITSSVPVGSIADSGGGFATWDGTSMATPFITGAFAVFRQFSPVASVDTIVNAFRSTGQPISITGGSVPRLNLLAAILASAPPSITTQPQGQTIATGQTAMLSVVATGAAPLSYQWYQGAAPSTTTPVGANAASFTTPALTTSTSYWVRVSNNTGHADSNTATITVQTVPADMNLLSNGDFGAGLSGWTSWSATAAVNGGVFELTLSGAPSSGFYQHLNQALPASAPLELTLQMGNSSAAAKTVVFYLNTPGFTSYQYCVFTVPAGAPLQSYVMRASTPMAWSSFDLTTSVGPGNGLSALRVDNVSLQYRPSLTVTSTQCALQSTPTDTNLLSNGDFSAGLSGWTSWSATAAVNGGVFELTPLSGAPSSGFYQHLNQALPASAPLELTLQMGNSSAAAKTVVFYLNTPGFTSYQYCVFTVPAGAPLQSYVMRASTPMAWSSFDLTTSVGPGNGLSALRVDNISVQYRPSLSVTTTQCALPPPTDTNLLSNGDFSAGLSGWTSWSATAAVNGGVFELTPLSGAPSSGFYQHLNQALPASAPLELTLQMGNSSAAAKTVVFYLNTPGFTSYQYCVFTVPAGAALQSYVMRASTPMAWSSFDLTTSVGPGDGLAALRVDNVSLEYRPSLTVTSTQCLPPAGAQGLPAEGTEQATPTATDTLVPTDTATPTATASPTELPILAPSELPTEPPTALPFPTLDLSPVVTEVASAEPTSEATTVITPELPTELPTALPFPTLPPQPSPTELPTTLPFPTLPPQPPPTLVSTPLPLELPAYASMDDGALDWAHTDNWTLNTRDSGLAWSMTGGSMETLRWNRPLDLRGAAPSVVLTFDSWFAGDGVATLAVSVDGINWQSVAAVPTSATWTSVEVDLSSYIGSVIQIAFVWQETNPATIDQWGVDNVSIGEVQSAPPVSETPTAVSPTPEATEAPTAEQSSPSATEQPTSDLTAP